MAVVILVDAVVIPERSGCHAERSEGSSAMPPGRVRLAVIALWAAWLVSAAALFVNQVLFHGSGIGPGPAMGVASLATQAVVFWFVRRGSRVARSFVIVIAVLAALPLPIVPRLVGERSVYSAGYLVIAFLLKVVAVWLLFTGQASAWFGQANGTRAHSIPRQR
jgi:hypothetical protein